MTEKRLGRSSRSKNVSFVKYGTSAKPSMGGHEGLVHRNVASHERSLAHKARFRHDDSHAGVAQACRDAGAPLASDFVHTAHDRRDVDTHFAVHADLRRSTRAARIMRGCEKRLRGRATDVDTGSSKMRAFEQHDALAGP